MYNHVGRFTPFFIGDLSFSTFAIFFGNISSERREDPLEFDACAKPRAQLCGGE